ncbi:CinA family protein [Microbacterium hibisci]|uniref:CinA family protein n=1 Tax=Microbacterium hibisci TaxID=2036000 RepID=UPI001943EA7C|nr:CinA family protein [Microbacterium hibisci]
MAGPIEQLSRLAQERGLTVSVAESLTSGLLASEVGKGEGAADWFSGGVVAYRMPVKTQVLGVPEGVDPCSAECATTLAAGVRSLLKTDIAVATTGVGGPDPEDGHAPGTVYLGWATAAGTGSEHFRLEGEPAEVLDGTVERALRLLVTLASDGDAAR